MSNKFLTNESISLRDPSQRTVSFPPARRRVSEFRSREEAIPRIANRASVPVSFAQQRLWFLSQLDPDNPAYHLPKAIRLKGALDIKALKSALDAVVVRHEALRIIFLSVDGFLTQTVCENRSIDLSIVDLTDWKGVDQEVQLKRVIMEIARRPFDLSSDLMLRAALLRLGKDDHVLLLVVHHIAADDESMNILFQELAALYKSFSSGKSSGSPELPIQYADYAVWQRQRLSGAVFQAELSYWKNRLTDVPILELPTDRTRPAVQTFKGKRQSLTLSRTLSDNLEELSRQEHATLFMVLLAAFYVLLHRYTERDDLAVGSPTAGRTRKETEGLIGVFSNTLVLRTDLSGDPSFRELLTRVREVVSSAYEHQELPFEKLIEELNPARDLSHTPLFQVLFAFEYVPNPSLNLPGLAVSSTEVDSGTANFDLTLSVTQADGSLTASLEYNTDLFEVATIGRMLGHFETLLQGVVTNPDRRLSAVPLLTERERQQLLVEWNDTSRDYPKDKCIHELFEAHAAQDPDAIAVVCREKSLAYGELNRRANQLARYLRKLGVGPEVMVGLCVERSLDMVVGLLGILKAGGAYVPIDPAYPKERMAFMLEDAAVPVLLTQDKLRERLPQSAARLIYLDTGWEEVARESVENPVSPVTPENLAYVIFTSGSTGRPKGVQVSHLSVTHLFYATRPLCRFDGHDIWTVVHSYAFDFSVWEIWGALLHGGRLVVVPLDVTQSPEAFYELLCREGVTVLNQTPSAIGQLVQFREKSAPSAEHFRLRLIVCGGEALHRELASSLLCWNVPLWNFYGPTESTVWAATNRIEAVDPRYSSIPLGRPFANIQMYILDSKLNPVPVGVPGELHIGGAGLARGYLKRPGLNVEKFISNPFSENPQARLYKTGDLARYLSDGNIEFLGRLDHQVKIRGFRIELGDIEAALCEHPAVREAVVVPHEGAAGDKRLVAYVTHDPQYSDAEGKLVRRQATNLRDFLQDKLPEYMIPATFMFLDALPLNPNGKVDRRALPAPSRDRSENQAGFASPARTIEHQLVQIWEELLDIHPIGIRDNFFELGGHSVLAAQMVYRIEQVCGERLFLSTLLAGPTIEQVAKALVEQRSRGRGPLLVKLQGGSKTPFFFLHADFRGGGFYCLNLARGLGEDQPFYALPPYGLDGGPRPPTVEAMAAGYIEMLRAAEPHGPYFLGGLCHGGLVAFEMARQLERQGEKVELVVMIGPAPSNPPRLRFVQDVVFAVGFVLGLDPEQRRKLFLKLRSHWLDLGRLSRYSGQRLAEVATWPFRQQVAWTLRLAMRIMRRFVPSRRHAKKLADASMEAANTSEGAQQLNRAIACYVRRPYSGRVALFWPVGDPVSMPDEPHLRLDQAKDCSLGWSQVVGPVEIHPVPGLYVTVVTRDVDTMANLIKARLDEAYA